MTDKIQMGEHARQAIENPALKKAIADIEASIFDTWRNTPVKDTEVRERLFAHVSVLRSVETMLNQMLGNGKLERATLDAAKNGTRR